MSYLFAYALSVGSPIAYALAAVLIGIPLLAIIVLSIDKIKNKW